MRIFCSLSYLSLCFFLTLRPPPKSTLFPYTTLFRSSPTKRMTRSTCWISPPTRVSTRWKTQKRLTPLCIGRSEEHTSELQSQSNLVCRLLLEKKKNQKKPRAGRHSHAHTISRRVGHT